MHTCHSPGPAMEAEGNILTKQDLFSESGIRYPQSVSVIPMSQGSR